MANQLPNQDPQVANQTMRTQFDTVLKQLAVTVNQKFAQEKTTTGNPHTLWAESRSVEAQGAQVEDSSKIHPRVKG